MKIKSFHLAIIIVIFIFGSIAAASAAGIWSTTNSKIPVTYNDGDFEGLPDPADIRGSYSFGDIENTFGVPAEDLGAAFGLKDPSTYASFKCKELEALYSSTDEEIEIGTGSVRYFVALYKGLPFESEEKIYLPKPALDVLKAKAVLSDEQIKSIEEYSIEIP